MLSNEQYNKIRLFYDLSRMIWFIDKHALIDAQKSNDAFCIKVFEQLKVDMEKHQRSLQKHLGESN